MGPHSLTALGWRLDATQRRAVVEQLGHRRQQRIGLPTRLRGDDDPWCPHPWAHRTQPGWGGDWAA